MDKHQHQIKLSNNWNLWFSYIAKTNTLEGNAYNFAVTLTLILTHNADIQELTPEHVNCCHGLAAIIISDALDRSIKNGFTDNIIKLSALLALYKKL